jgi:hypothetical protein
MVSAFLWWWGEQSRLRLFRQSPGAVCLLAFTGDTVAVGACFDNQSEDVRDKSELVLRNGQAASVTSHGGFSFG